MGRFVNSGNSAFQVALNSEIYVDKTGLLAYTNKVMDTTAKFICNSRPRRFGKSITADMLTAYYCKGCSSEEMFSSLEIGPQRCCFTCSIDTNKTCDTPLWQRECHIFQRKIAIRLI